MTVQGKINKKTKKTKTKQQLQVCITEHITPTQEIFFIPMLRNIFPVKSTFCSRVTMLERPHGGEKRKEKKAKSII